MKKVSVRELSGFFQEIARAQKLYLPIERAGAVDFDLWSEGESVRLDALKTVRSAKDMFFPQVENLMKFRVEGKSIEVEVAPLMAEDFVLFGVRGCDARSFDILDRVFLTEPRDEFYAARRAHCTVVSLACAMPEESCFCTNFGIDPALPSGDATAWMIGEEIYLQANTEKGERLIQNLEDADGAAVEGERARIAEIAKRLPLNDLPLEGFGEGALLETGGQPFAAGARRGGARRRGRQAAAGRARRRERHVQGGGCARGRRDRHGLGRSHGSRGRRARRGAAKGVDAATGPAQRGTAARGGGRGGQASGRHDGAVRRRMPGARALK